MGISYRFQDKQRFHHHHHHLFSYR